MHWQTPRVVTGSAKQVPPMPAVAAPYWQSLR
jgi:hypothetical protein